MQASVRVLIVDDHRVFAESLRLVLSSDERIDVVGVAYDGYEAVSLATSLRPDAILMDVDMPRLDGIEATLRIREAGSTARIVVLTGGQLPAYEDSALAADADAFLKKDTALDGVAEALVRPLAAT